MEKINIIGQKIKKHRITLLVFGAIILFHSWSLMRIPAPFVDEAWLIARAWSYLNTGQNFGQLDIGFFDHFDGYWTFFPLIQTWIYLPTLYIVGAPSLVAGRIVSLFIGILLLVAVFWIGKHLNGYRLAIIGVILVSLSWAFRDASHLARPDIISATAGYAAIALYLNNKSDRWWISLIAGLLTGISFEFHPNGMLLFFPVMGILFLRDNGWRLFENRLFWVFSGGVSLSLGLYAIQHILPYPETYKTLINIFSGEAYQPPLFTFQFDEIWHTIIQTSQLILRRFLLETILLVWQVIVLLKRKSSSDITLYSLTFTLLLGFSLLIRNKFSYYFIYISPILYLVLASFLDDFIQRPLNKSFWSRMNFIVVWTAIFSMTTLILLPNSTNQYTEYKVAQKRLNESINPEDVVMGSQTYWLGLTEYEYLSWENLTYHQYLDPDSSLEDRFQYYQPDIFIIDGHNSQFITDNPERLPYAGRVSISLTELNMYLDINAKLIDEFQSEGYGLIQIYRINYIP